MQKPNIIKIIIITILIQISLSLSGQNKQVEELSSIYMSGDYDKTIKKANEFIKNDTNNIDFNILLGRALVDKGDYKSAIPYLDYSAKNDSNNSWRKAWALGYLGTCHFMLQDYDNSKKMINECLDLNATKNATLYAYKRITLFGFDDFFKDWKIVESDNFRFHFQNMLDAEINKYILTREDAFQNINIFFDSKLPKKIDFFVWGSRDDAKKILKADLGFAYPEFCIIHSYIQQTKGHEITHVISNYSTKIINKTGLINEGTSVCFDLTNQNKEQIVKNWLETNNQKISIKNIWTNWNNYPEEISYPLSGLFVKELIDNFGREKFIEFFGNQTFENAKSIFGDKLYTVIKDFENKINM